MQLQLHFSLSEPLTLPISYHHIIQGFIYRLLSSDISYSTFLHEEGYTNGVMSYKLFCYSLLQGQYHIVKNHIIFQDEIALEIRCISPQFFQALSSALMPGTTFRLEHQNILLTSVHASNTTITSNQITIRMNSPLCASQTIHTEDKKNTLYLSPKDSDFPEAISRNFERKYEAAFHKKPEQGIKISRPGNKPAQKYVTKFKNSIYITAWNGTYQLEGSPEALTFLYNTGLGSRNSQGFGQFMVLEKE